MHNIFDSDGNNRICNERVVCFNISRTWQNRERADLYECTRKYWRLNGARAGHADLVFAVCQGVVIGVFKPHSWYRTQCAKYAGRWEFEGEQLVNSSYLNLSLIEMRRRQNPVMYINL